MNNLELIFIWIFSGLIFIPAALIDYKTQRIPNLLSLGGSLIIIIIRIIFFNTNILIFIISGIYGFAVFLLIERVLKGKMGFGDIKLSLCIGLTIGFWGWHVSVFTASAFGIIMYVLVKNRTKNKIENETKNSHKGIPFAPFLLAGQFTALILISIGILPFPI